MPKDFSGGPPPNLTYTKLLSAEIGGKALGKADTHWNGLLAEAVIQAAEKLKDANALKQLIIVNHVIGRKEDQGYRFLASAGISVQRQDAINAWKAVSHIAKTLFMPSQDAVYADQGCIRVA